MNRLDKQYTDLLQDILDNGVKKGDRTGTGTLSVFGRQIRHKMSDGFPLLTTKKMPFKTIVTELLWFLRGDTNIKFLVDNNCHIWDGDAYKSYLKEYEKDTSIGGNVYYTDPLTYKPYFKEEFINKIKTDDEFAKKWGDLGPVYGAQWRRWSVYPNEYGEYESNPTDQIANLINDLKTNPDSRRLMVNAWNVGELDSMVLPPCHYGFQVYTRELSMDERQRLYIETCNRLKTPSIKGSTNKETMESYFQEYNIPTRAISLMWQQRSVDTFLGLPFNIASYALLLEIIAKEVNMIPDELIGNLGDTHLYLNHIEQAKEQIGEIIYEDSLTLYSPFHNDGITKKIPIGSTREPYPLPTLKHMKTDEFYKSLSEDVSLFAHLNNTDFVIEGYQSHPTIKAPLSN